MSSKRPSDPPGGSLHRLEEDLPTSAADVAALRAARRRQPPNPLEHPERLAAPEWAPRRPRRTAEGWEPFEL